MSALVVLLGHAIGYSASPAIHNAAFAALELDARYELRDVPGERLSAEVRALRGSDRLGANVTKPHKLAVCELVDELVPDVRRLGAANAIVRDGHRLVAHNTDLPALVEELRGMLAERGGFVVSTLVLGAGGAARAAVAALEDLGAGRTTVLTRRRWEELPDAIRDADLLVNATPIGTSSDESPVPYGLLRPDLAVLDLVYRPSPTRLVRDARAAGAVARDGAGMLLRQAEASFTLWTGRHAPVEVMREALGAELGVGSGA